MAARRRTQRHAPRTTSAPRIISRGAITFGPVHIPVASAEVIDLVAMLKKSLRGGKDASTTAPARASRRARHARSHRSRRDRRSA